MMLVRGAPGGMFGDLNGDEAVSVFDAIIALQIVVGLVEPTRYQGFFGDLNSDSDINVFDAIIGLQHIVGLITLHECGSFETN